MMLQHLFILWDKFNCPQRGIQILQQKKQCFDNLRTKRLSWSGLLLGKLGPYSRFSFLQKILGTGLKKNFYEKNVLELCVGYFRQIHQCTRVAVWSGGSACGHILECSFFNEP